MSNVSELELAVRENFRKIYTGIPEKDVISMARAAITSGGYTDSLEKPGVPKGRLVDGSITSQIYPNSYRTYQVYLPAGYDPAVAYPFTIFLDGMSYYLSADVNANIALDNLIAEKRIPAMIGIFLEPGDKGEGMPIWGGAYEDPLSNRSFEYDSTDDTFARFLLEELLPQISAEFKLTDDPDLRCLCGASSGGQAVFNAAWHRPDSFRKVMSFIGSFTSMRGGDCNPVRIRKSPRKPLRVFLQDGEADANIIYGDMVLANKTMASALEYRDYDYKFVLGKGGHNFIHIGAILPEALEWTWR